MAQAALYHEKEEQERGKQEEVWEGRRKGNRSIPSNK
jgi:hypothetical protein